MILDGFIDLLCNIPTVTSVLIRCAIKRYQNIPGGLYQIFQFFSNKMIGKVRVVVLDGVLRCGLKQVASLTLLRLLG